jgi:sugar lactone lactonase YvrE
VAVDKVGNIYVSSVGRGSDQIWKIAPSGKQSLLADFGPPGGGACGLAVDPVGNVYMARTLAAAPYYGVCRVDPDGNIVLLPGTDQIIFPDGLAFDQRGNLCITEVFSIDPSSGGFAQGGIWRVPKGGTAEVWLRDDLLSGLGNALYPFPVGANGIAFYRAHLYVANTDRAIVVQVAVLPDGSPGQPETWQQLEEVPVTVPELNFLPLMADGLALDVHGNVYVAVPTRCAIVRINADDRSQATVARYPEAPLDALLSLAFGTGKGGRQNLFVTGQGSAATIFPHLPWPGAGLVKIEVGILGLPLP